MGIYDQPSGPPDYSMYDIRCQRCKQDPCECCQGCGAGPDQACEEQCGLTGIAVSICDNCGSECLEVGGDPDRAVFCCNCRNVSRKGYVQPEEVCDACKVRIEA